MSLTDQLHALKVRGKEEMKSPLTRIHYHGKGMLEVIEAVEDKAFEIEDANEKLRNKIAWEERNSGRGRGDSMG